MRMDKRWRRRRKIIGPRGRRRHDGSRGHGNGRGFGFDPGSRLSCSAKQGRSCCTKHPGLVRDDASPGCVSVSVQKGKGREKGSYSTAGFERDEQARNCQKRASTLCLNGEPPAVPRCIFGLGEGRRAAAVPHGRKRQADAEGCAKHSRTSTDGKATGHQCSTLRASVLPSFVGCESA